MRDGFVLRYRHRRAASTACRPARARSSPARFWLADNLRAAWAARDEARGAVRAAARRCATTSACSPRSTTRGAGRLLGNFPQAFSHVGLVNTALNLDRAAAARESG